jgi:hypothetical protein
VTFLFSDHLALTQGLGFPDTLLFRLLDAARPGGAADLARRRP